MDFNRGGQEVIKRLLSAYGFKTRQALCQQLGASTSTMSTRWMRDIFPADWVIQCSIETGASLEWLSFGKGEMFQNGNKKTSNGVLFSANEQLLGDITSVTRKKLIDGNLYDSSFYMFDKSMIPSHITKPVIVMDGEIEYVAEQSFTEISDGTWLVEIEGKAGIKTLVRVPVGRVHVTSSEGGHSFECSIDDIKPLAKCHYYLMTDV